MIKEYRTIGGIAGSLMIVREVTGVKCGEICEVSVSDGRTTRCKVLEIDGSNAIVQLFSSPEGISTSSKVRFLGRGLEFAGSPDILGRIFSGMGEPVDNAPRILPKKVLNVNGTPINPSDRRCPSDFIQTGISVIDGLNPLVRGQTLPIFTGSGLPHAQFAAQIARQTKMTIVFAAIGATFEEADVFISDFRRTGAIDRAALFINLASDPVIERIVTPRIAVRAAEYLAYEEHMHVLVIMTDLANYADALRELSSARGGITGRHGYPVHLHADFAAIYERSGVKHGNEGSVTILPILTMPGDDSKHPIPELTGYSANGQIVLSRDMNRKIYPPVDVMRSISRLKPSVREDHASVANQLLTCYASRERGGLYAKFANTFEERYISQDRDEERTLEETLNLSWELLSIFPKSTLSRISSDHIAKYWRGNP